MMFVIKHTGAVDKTTVPAMHSLFCSYGNIDQ